MQPSLRWAKAGDFPILADVMFDAVRNGPSRYSEEQRQAWVPAPREGREWDERLAAQDVIIAEQGPEALGFMSFTREGYIDFAYIRPKARGTGLFRRMLERIERRARAKGIALLWVHASLNAEAAFAAGGYAVRRREQVSIGTARFERCEMEKALIA